MLIVTRHRHLRSSFARDERRGASSAAPAYDDPGSLVSGMRGGHSEARAAFYARYARAVHAYVRARMGADEDLDDVVHDTFVRALESLGALREPSALRAWVLGIAARTVAIRFQKRRRQRWLCFMAPEDVPSLATTPDREIEEAMRDLQVVLDGMDVEERAALILHRVAGLSLEDSAREARTSLATFRRRLARGGRKLDARARHRPALAAWMADRSGGRSSRRC